MTELLIGLFTVVILFAIFKQPKCPKCGSKDIGLFSFHTKKVFTCHDCGHKDNEDSLDR